MEKTNFKAKADKWVDKNSSVILMAVFSVGIIIELIGLAFAFSCLT